MSGSEVDADEPLDVPARRVRRELSAVLLTLTALLVGLVVAGLWISRDLNRSAQRAYVEEVIPAQARVQDLALQMVNQETGMRAFLVTGRASSLEPYVAGRRQARADLEALARLARGQPAMSRLIAVAGPQIAGLETFFDSQIARVRSGPAGVHRAQARVDTGKALFDAFRRTARAMTRTTDALVARTVSAQRARYRELVAVLALVGALAIVVAAGLAIVIPRRAGRLVEQRSRRLAEERQARETLDRVLAATPGFHTGTDPDDVARDVCAAALVAFGCAAASLWEVEGDTLRLAHRVPWADAYAAGDVRPIAELPGLREALDEARPMFVADLHAHSAGATRATAEATGSGSLLNVPIAIAGVTQLQLGLLWDERIPQPSPALRAAAQRFADQAGLALEQARRRRAQAEIESLNRTLQQMVDTDPLFRAGGTRAEVGEAICAAALRIFGARGCALWTQDAAGELELLHRAPPSPVLPLSTRLSLARFPSFRAALGGGRPRFVADVQQDEPDLWNDYARHSGSRSQLRLPLASAGGASSLIVLSWPSRLEPPTRQERAVAARFADQAALALAEATRRDASIEAEEMHATFERSLLPNIEVSAPGVRVATLYRPGEARLSLGGDFYDYLELDGDRVAVLLGDVSGHGPAAAAIGAALRSAWRALVLAGVQAADLMPGLERVLQRQHELPEMFVTAIAATVDLHRPAVSLVTAGHPAPLVFGAASPLELRPGPPLGAEGGGEWPVVEHALARPSALIFYTDGLFEGRTAPGSSERFGTDRLGALLDPGPAAAVEEVDLERAVAAVTAANGGGLPDDVAVLALNLGAASPGG